MQKNGGTQSPSPLQPVLKISRHSLEILRTGKIKEPSLNGSCIDIVLDQLFQNGRNDFRAGEKRTGDFFAREADESAGRQSDADRPKGALLDQLLGDLHRVGFVHRCAETGFRLLQSQRFFTQRDRLRFS